MVKVAGVKAGVAVLLSVTYTQVRILPGLMQFFARRKIMHEQYYRPKEKRVMQDRLKEYLDDNPEAQKIETKQEDEDERLVFTLLMDRKEET